MILNGLGKDAAYIISRVNGFTFVETQYDYSTGKLNVLSGEGVFRRRTLQGQGVTAADDVS